MEHDGGKRLKPKGALSALKQYKYVVLTAALGIFLLLLPPGEGKTADTGRTPTAAEHFDRAALQTEMEDILSSLDGVGRLSLMLTVDGGSEYELAQDETDARKFSGTESGEQSRSSAAGQAPRSWSRAAAIRAFSAPSSSARAVTARTYSSR